MTDHSTDAAPILTRARTVFGTQPFTIFQLRIETNRRNDAVREALDALIAAGQVERIDGFPTTYKVKQENA